MPDARLERTRRAYDTEVAFRLRAAQKLRAQHAGNDARVVVTPVIGEAPIGNDETLGDGANWIDLDEADDVRAVCKPVVWSVWIRRTANGWTFIEH